MFTIIDMSSPINEIGQLWFIQNSVEYNAPACIFSAKLLLEQMPKYFSAISNDKYCSIH